MCSLRPLQAVPYAVAARLSLPAAANRRCESEAGFLILRAWKKAALQRTGSAMASPTRRAVAAESASLIGSGPMHLMQHSRCSRRLVTRAAHRDSTAASLSQYSLLAIAGDGRCMFRSLAQGHHIAAQQDAAAESGFVRPQLLDPSAETARADELRLAICQELLNRRDELCFFIDDDYDTYVRRMQQPHTWGGEPELAVATHVLQRPISVFTIYGTQLAQVSKYGAEEYLRKEVHLFFHGAGHYDLLVPSDFV